MILQTLSTANVVQDAVCLAIHSRALRWGKQRSSGKRLLKRHKAVAK